MDIRNRAVGIRGTFTTLDEGEAERRLRAAGVRVTDELAETDVLFVGERLSEGEREDCERASAEGILQYENEEALLRALDEVERPDEPSPDDAPGATPELEDVSGDAAPPEAPARFVDHAELRDAEPDRLVELLDEADWARFLPERDLLPLRERLSELEAAHGVTPAHRVATDGVRSYGTLLSRPYGHRSTLVALALSPDGHHLATGSWYHEDQYGENGVLQVWELATGRCVNTLDFVEGGLGWYGHRRTMQWSADGRTLGMVVNTNEVSTWDPFGASIEPWSAADVTPGVPRPPSWALHPDGRRAYIAAGKAKREGVNGALVPLDRGRLHWPAERAPKQHPFWLDAKLPTSRDGRHPRSLWVENPQWSADGQRLYSRGRRDAFVVDLERGEVRWHAPVGDVSAWSPDFRYLAHTQRRRIHFLDAETGEEVERSGGREPADLLPKRTLGRANAGLYWAARGSVARLAAVLGPGSPQPGVHLYEDGVHRHHLPVQPARAQGGTDFEPWAWAPSGERAALLTHDGGVEIWALDGAEPELLRTENAPYDALGLVWGAGDVLVAAGPRSLRFLCAVTGELLGDYTFLRTPDAEPPLAEEAMEELWGIVFALDEETWCLPVEPESAIAPPERREEVEAVQAWTVDRRYSWPLRWGRFDIWPDAETASPRLRYDSFTSDFVHRYPHEVIDDADI
ncbi:hypothetical protein E0L36_24705 [Streptomyces sp. AJS327]|uniref:WD40 repeat domain-containing protein n=1 Tax=Streptomyces sp. AJS327 TaxID=2545265 RepID=UPI0015E04FAA|nr:hypothetical protein [Streptomyces sp. AJS327]MBA0053934.1 hypothetical protein [Streptomyces sp. AJS327]